MAEVTGYTKTQVDTLLGDKADALGPDDNYVTDEEKTALANLGTAAAAAAEDFAPAGSGAYPVQQVTLTADLAYTLPVGAPADQVISVVFTQPEQEPTGYTVTYGGAPVTVDTAVGASTLVEVWPGGTLVYPGASAPAGASSTITADDTPAAPAEGESASYLVTSAVTWPAGLVWSTDPDGGVAPAITGTALVSLFTVGGVTRAVMGATFPAPPDTTAPVAGTLASSSITETGFTLTVTGASDVGGLHAQPYSFDTGSGTFGAWQTPATLAVTGKTAGTAYTCRHKVRDAAGNETTGASITVTTVAADTTAPVWTATLTPGTPTETAVVVAASALATDNVGVTGYEVSYNGGSTWAAITPSGSNFTLAGTAGTTYATTKLRAKDAAGNTSTPVLSVPSYTMAASADVTAPTVGTMAASAITSSGFTLTVSGATDETALHAQPYAFTTDGGATWTAYQASPAYVATGKAASTGYSCNWRVRDAAGSVSTGTAQTVTTAAPFAPSDIAGLDLWLKADAITGLSDGANVTSWTDSSTAANHATQGTAGLQPTYQTAEANGLPVVRFDATDDRLVSACSLSGPELTIIAVLKRNGTAVGKMVAPNSAGLGGFCLLINASTLELIDQGVAIIGTASATLGTTAYKIVAATFSDSGNSWTIRVNGVATASGSYAATLAAGKTTMIGYDQRNSNGPLNADVAEILHYSAALSVSDLQAIETYLTTKWGVA